MKIGILTVHRAINVGAVLQCYALQEVLKSMGHDVWVIDYRQEKVERVDRTVYDWRKRLNMLWHGHPRGFLFYRRIQKLAAKSYKRYDDFISQYLRLTDPCDKDHIPTDFDYYVIGSDQLWNSNIFCYHDEVFWGNFAHSADSKIVAYAPSSSARNLKESDQNFLRRSLGNFSCLSVREQEVAVYLQEHFQMDVKTVLDPTLLANRRVWDNLKTGKHHGEKYLLVYGARPYHGNPNILYDMAEPLARQLGCEVRGLHYDILPDFVDLISNATAVVTSSFHGVAFSLIFNRPLYAVKYSDEQDARYVNLLQRIGAAEMIVDAEDLLSPFHNDYRHINTCLVEEREQSSNYLLNACL